MVHSFARRARPVLLSLLLLLLSLPVFTGCSSPFPLNAATYQNAEKYSVGSFDYDPASVTEITIRWYVGEVSMTEVVPDDNAARLTVKETEKDVPDDQRLHYYLDGTTLRIEAYASGYRSDLSVSRKKLAVEIPAGVSVTVLSTAADVRFHTHTLDKVNVNTVSGTVRAEDLTASEIYLGTISGNLDCGVLNAGSVTISTTSGHQTADTIAVRGGFTAGSISGAIRIGSLTAAIVDAETTSGRIDLLVTACPSLTLSTVSGAVAVTLPEEMGVDLTYSTVSGTLNARDFTREENGHYRRAGENPMAVSVETTSGALTVR